MMSWIWFFLMAVSLDASLITGSFSQMTAALFRGADSAVTLVLSLAGILCFWSGVIRVLEETGISDRLAAQLSPLLRRIFPQSMQDKEAASALAGNVTANLLGLGNAATPAGIRAAKAMAGADGRSALRCWTGPGDGANPPYQRGGAAAVRSAGAVYRRCSLCCRHRPWYQLDHPSYPAEDA